MPKRRLRNLLEQRRKAHTAEDVAVASRLICDILAALPELKEAESVIGYYPHQQEVDIKPFLLEALKRGQRLFLPIFNEASGVYQLAQIGCLKQDLRRGRYGILEPHDHLHRHEGHHLPSAAWIIPGLGFDSSGNRLGRGGGYYDRLLKDTEHLKVAVGYHWQLVDEIPSEDHDMTMNLLVTDNAVMSFMNETPGDS